MKKLIKFVKISSKTDISSVDIGMELEIDRKTVMNHLRKADYKKKLDVWVPRKLSVKNIIDRIINCDALLKRNEIEPFLKRFITGDNGSRTTIGR